MAIIVDDPDASTTFAHWVVFNLPTDLRAIPENQPESVSIFGGVHGKNDFGMLGYRGQCPPSGPAHTYRFTLFAVGISLDLFAASPREQVLAALEGHILEKSLLTGTYKNTTVSAPGAGGGY
jgi:Raf kinase inhibitor-like YbhB/YbcL family protein